VNAYDGNGTSQVRMLAPTLVLTRSAVPVVAIRAVLGRARRDRLFRVRTEELEAIEGTSRRMVKREAKGKNEGRAVGEELRKIASMRGRESGVELG